MSPAPTSSRLTDSASPLSAVLVLLLGATAIGFSSIFVRHADVGPAAIAFWRMLFALPFLTVWAWAERPTIRAAAHEQPRPALSRRAAGALVLAGLAFAADMVLFHLSLQLTTVAKAALLGNAGPIFVVVLAWLIWRQRPTRPVLIALAVAVTGTVLLISPQRLSDPLNIGDVYGVGAALAYAVYLMAIQRARQSVQAGLVGVGSSAVSAVACLVLALSAGEAIVPQSVTGWIAVMALGVVSHALGQGLVTLAMGKVSAGIAAVVLIYPALVSTLAAWGLFGEVPTSVQLAGGALILAALLMVRR